MRASLSGLTIGALTLAPSFNPKTTAYAATTENQTNTITATAEEGVNISITVNGNAHTNGQPATWSAGENTVQILASAEGKTSTLYTVTVTKQAPEVRYAEIDWLDTTDTSGSGDDGFIEEFTDDGAGNYSASIETQRGTETCTMVVDMRSGDYSPKEGECTWNGDTLTFTLLEGFSNRYTADLAYVVGENTLVIKTWDGGRDWAEPATYTITVTNTEAE